MALSNFPHAEKVKDKCQVQWETEMGNPVLRKGSRASGGVLSPLKSDFDLDLELLWAPKPLNILVQEESRVSKACVSILSPTSSLRVTGPWFFFHEDVGLHSYTQLRHCAKDHTYLFNKISSLRLLGLQCCALAFNAEKIPTPYSQDQSNRKMKKKLLLNLYFLSVQLENRF